MAQSLENRRPLASGLNGDVRPETAGFVRAAREYERGRPGYPPECVAYIVGAGRLGPGRTVVDLAAGTGKLTRELVASGAHVVAVEPLEEMRVILEESVPGARVREGLAEETGLPAASADAVTVAQAFHWFATDAALTEIGRVLRPGGLLFLVWNRRDVSDPVQKEISRLTAPFVGDAPSYSSDEWRRIMAATELFAAAGEHHCYSEQEVDQHSIVDRVASTSYIATLEGREKTELLSRVAALVPDRGTVSLAYDTATYSFTRR